MRRNAGNLNIGAIALGLTFIQQTSFAHAGKPRVAVVAAATNTANAQTNTRFTDVRDKLLATGFFDSVGIINVTGIGDGIGTPPLSMLQEYDAIDTGAFLCSRIIFEYLRRAQQDGDCSLSDGMRLLAADGKASAIDIGDAWWQDVDTPEMLARAEEESARLLRDSGSRLAQESVARES